MAGLQAARDILLFRPIILFIDSKSLMYIRLCRNASEQIARLSVQLSSFEVELFHVPSNLNLADNFTRLRVEEEEPSDDRPMRSLSEKESHEIVRQLIIPHNFSLPSPLLNTLLNQDSVLVDLPPKRKRKTTICKEIPRKTTCPTIQGSKKLKDFILEVGETPNHHACNMVLETDENGGPSNGEERSHGEEYLEVSGTRRLSATVVKQEEERIPTDDLDIEESVQDGTTRREYNALQDLTIPSKVFEEGSSSRKDYRRAKEKDVQITETIRDNRLQVVGKITEAIRDNRLQVVGKTTEAIRDIRLQVFGKTTCPTIQGSKKLKDFILEVGETQNFHACNMVQVTDENGGPSNREEDSHGDEYLEASGTRRLSAAVIDEGEGRIPMDGLDTEEGGQDDTPRSEYNALQDLTISSKVFEEGLISKKDFRKAQENGVQPTELS